MRLLSGTPYLLALAAALAPATAPAAARQRPAANASIQTQLNRALQLIEEQRTRLDSQQAQIAELQRRLDASAAQIAQAPARAPTASPDGPPLPAIPAAQGAAPGADAVVSVQQAPPLERVGQAPEDDDRPIELAVLDTQGSVVTRRGQLTGELQVGYARADRNRAVSRGIELVEAVLVGVFDINESRQDVLSASASLRYGVTDRLELGIRLPYVYRADTSIIAPISGSTPNDMAATIDNSVKGNGIGDLEPTARYQLLDGGNGRPFLIGNLQAIAPTGSDPFAFPAKSSDVPVAQRPVRASGASAPA